MEQENVYSENNENLDIIPLNGTGIQVNVPIVIPFLPFGLLIIFITILGLIGNSLCALVLSRTRLRSSYSVLTLGLTFCDSVYLITKLIRYGLDSLFTYFEITTSYTNLYLPIIGPYLRPITFTAHTGSTYFTMALAVDRYIAVCWAPKHRFLCTRHRARYYNVMILLFAIMYNMTRWWEFHTETEKIYNLNGDLETYHTMKISPLRENADYRLYYIFWAYLIVMFLIPFSTLTTLNLVLWCAPTWDYDKSKIYKCKECLRSKEIWKIDITHKGIGKSGHALFVRCTKYELTANIFDELFQFQFYFYTCCIPVLIAQLARSLWLPHIIFKCVFDLCRILYRAMAAKISKINRKMPHPSSVQSRDYSFALMLIGVVVVFLMCNLDYLILDLLEFFSQSYSEFWNHVGNVLLTVNSAVNFIIYCLCGKNFRRELVALFRDWFGQLEQTGESADNSADHEFGFVNNTNTMEARL